MLQEMNSKWLLNGNPQTPFAHVRFLESRRPVARAKSQDSRGGKNVFRKVSVHYGGIFTLLIRRNLGYLVNEIQIIFMKLETQNNIISRICFWLKEKG